MQRLGSSQSVALRSYSRRIALVTSVLFNILFLAVFLPAPNHSPFHRWCDEDFPWKGGRGLHYHACQPPTSDWHGVRQLQPIRIWRSLKQQRNESVTIVTQLSLARLDMLLSQCTVWRDRIAATIYTPLLGNKILSMEDVEEEAYWSQVWSNWNQTDLSAAINKLNSMHAQTDKEDGCSLDIELVVEDFESLQDPYSLLYPVNALRNRALQLAQTEAVLPLDVDFLPSVGFVEDYSKPEAYKALMADLVEKHAIVLPAFKSGMHNGRETALAAVKLGKDFVANRVLNTSSLDAFSQCPECHGPTNYTKWFQAKTLYRVQYKFRYEPYVVVAKTYVPWYDERFRGYYQNKIEHLSHLAGLGVQFMVHPKHFVVHVAHTKSAARNATNKTGERRRIEVLAASIRDELAKGVFVPVTSFAVTNPQLCQ